MRLIRRHWTVVRTGMPTAPKRPCTYPGCPELVERGRCDAHKSGATKVYEQQRGSSNERGYDWKWRRFRPWYLNRHPMCEASMGCNQLATEIHHIVRLEDGGEKYDEANLQALCKPHHSSKRGAGGRV